MHQPISNEVVIRKSVFTLLVRGAWAWILIAMLSFIANLIIKEIGGTSALEIVLPNDRIIGTDALIQFVFFFLYGALILYIVLAWITDYYIIRDTDVVERKGVIVVNSADHDLQEIENITVHQGTMGRLFGFGTIELSNPRYPEKVQLVNVPHPQQLASRLQELSVEHKKSINHNPSVREV